MAAEVQDILEVPPPEPVVRSWWDVAAVVYGGRRLIVLATGLAAVLSVIVSLLIPVSYTASTRLLLPESSGSLPAAMFGNLSFAARALLGGSGDYARYLSILTSRSSYTAVIDEFDLVAAYELEKSAAPMDDAIKKLAASSAFDIDREFEHLSISVTDHDRERAAAMANYFAEELNRTNARLSSLSAANFRRYVERRYRKSAADRDSLLDRLLSFQKTYGIIDLEAQTQAYFEQVGLAGAALMQVEIEYQSLRSRYGAANAQTAYARDVYLASRRKYDELMQGVNAVIPVAVDTIPEAVREYANIELERTIQTSILETIAPVLEQAKFDEQRETEAVQVVDVAVPPARKSKPKRAVVVLASTVSAFILSVIAVLLFYWWNSSGRAKVRRVQRGAGSGRRL